MLPLALLQRAAKPSSLSLTVTVPNVILGGTRWYVRVPIQPVGNHSRLHKYWLDMNARKPMDITYKFEAPIRFEAATLGGTHNLHATARYLSGDCHKGPCLHLDPRGGFKIGANESGTLAIDLWATESTDHRAASMLFKVDSSLVTVVDGHVNGCLKGNRSATGCGCPSRSPISAIQTGKQKSGPAVILNRKYRNML